MKNTTVAPKNDPFTGESFIPKRSNQKFANLKNKTAYNNAGARQKINEKKPILEILNQNEKVLTLALGSAKERTVNKDYLIGAGFRFGYYTGTVFYNRLLYTRIFNFGFFAAAKDNFIICKIV